MPENMYITEQLIQRLKVVFIKTGELNKCKYFLLTLSHYSHRLTQSN